MNFLEAIEEMKKGKVVRISGSDYIYKIIDSVIMCKDSTFDHSFSVMDIEDSEIESQEWEVADPKTCPTCGQIIEEGE